MDPKNKIKNQIDNYDHEIFCIECKDRMNGSDYERIAFLHDKIMELKFKLYEGDK